MPLQIPASLRWFVSFKLLVAAAAFVLWLAIIFAAKGIILAIVRRTYRRRSERLDMIVTALSPALRLAILILGVQFALGFIVVPVTWQKFIDFAVIGTVVLALIIAADGLLRLWMRFEAERFPILGEDYGVVTGALRGALVGLGLMMFLES